MDKVIEYVAWTKLDPAAFQDVSDRFGVLFQELGLEDIRVRLDLRPETDRHTFKLIIRTSK